MHIWHHFVNSANDLGSSYVEMIHPSGWIKGGIRLNATRDRWIRDKNLAKVHLLEYEAFPGVGLGQTTITFFNNTDKTYEKPTLIVYDKENSQKIVTELDWSKNYYYETEDTKRTEDIIAKFRPTQSKDSMADFVSAQRNLGIEGKHFKAKNHSTFSKEPIDGFTVKVLVNERLLDDTEKRDYYYIDASDPYWSVRWDDVDYYKVVFPATGNKQSSKNYLLNKGELATDKYLMVLFNNIEEARNYQKYLSTKFYAFAMMPLLVDQNALRKTHRNTPKQDFTNDSDIDWSKSIPEIEQQLYKKYNLSEDEIKFIEEKIKPME